MARKRPKLPYIERAQSGVMLPMLVTGQRLGFNSTRVQSGRRRGMRYEVAAIAYAMSSKPAAS